MYVTCPPIIRLFCLFLSLISITLSFPRFIVPKSIAVLIKRGIIFYFFIKKLFIIFSNFHFYRYPSILPAQFPLKYFILFLLLLSTFIFYQSSYGWLLLLLFQLLSLSVNCTLLYLFNFFFKFFFTFGLSSIGLNVVIIARHLCHCWTGYGKRHRWFSVSDSNFPPL